MTDAPEVAVKAPFAGVVVTVDPDLGALVHAETPVVVLEAMKMEHEVLAGASGTVARVQVKAGDSVGAGDVALLGCCDVVIATEDSSIGMGGPAMIEGGGLGVYEPSEVGPIDVQHSNGVVDLRVADDHAAVAAAKRYLSYFHGPAVRLGLRRELAAIDDAQERERVFEATVAAAYEHGKGVNMAAYGEIDDVIDPADSRRWIASLFDPPAEDWRGRECKRRANVDSW